MIITVKSQPLIGNSDLMQDLRHNIEMVAKTHATVLILGNTGTGKELVAQQVHLLSAVKGPFVPINCAAIPNELLESELFGHAKGAFTGADKTRLGRFEQAANGTLFLDEIGDMPIALQSKLLRVLEDKTFQKVGSGQDIPMTSRLVFATHQNIESQVNSGEFRADLYYRINVFPINTPDLAKRQEDIPEIIEHLINDMSQRLAHDKPLISDEAKTLLRQYSWPGNVRELRNHLERLTILSAGKKIDSELVNTLLKNNKRINQKEENDALWEATAGFDTDPTSVSDTAEKYVINVEKLLENQGFKLKPYLAEVERSLIEAAMKKNGQSVAAAARSLGIQRTTLAEKIKKLNY